MPKSDYQCQDEKCGHIFEFEREPNTSFPAGGVKCEKCGGTQTIRIFSRPVVAVGQGFDKMSGQYFSAPLTPTSKVPGGIHDYDLSSSW